MSRIPPFGTRIVAEHVPRQETNAICAAEGDLPRSRTKSSPAPNGAPGGLVQIASFQVTVSRVPAGALERDLGREGGLDAVLPGRGQRRDQSNGRDRAGTLRGVSGSRSGCYVATFAASTPRPARRCALTAGLVG